MILIHCFHVRKSYLQREKAERHLHVLAYHGKNRKEEEGGNLQDLLSFSRKLWNTC